MLIHFDKRNKMVHLVFNFIIVVIAFIAMECVAWLTHKYIMHGLCWGLHRDHHKKDTYGFLERNDFFFLIFAIPGIISLFSGMKLHYDFLFYVGVGITIYGGAYFFIHDIFIHQRIKMLRNSNNPYFKAIRRAHKMHHKHLDRTDGECFGMLWVPFKYFRSERQNNPA